MAKEKKEKNAAELFREKMLAGIRSIQKDLKVESLSADAPLGSDGAITTGSLVVDLIMGGGFPAKRLTTVAGPESSGKTTLVMKSEGIQLKNGLFCHHLDVEGAVDPTWALKNGLDMDQYLGKKKGSTKTLHYIRDFDSGDDAFRYMSRTQDEAIDLYLKLGAREDANLLPALANAYFLDSAHACVSELFLENDEAGSAPRLAIMLNDKLPMVRMKLAKSHSVAVIINQIRINPRASFGNPEYEPGGKALAHYADVKLVVHRTGKPKTFDGKDHKISPSDTKDFKEGGISIERNPDGTEDRYFYTEVKSIKNRVFPPMKKTYMRIWAEHNGAVGNGIDPVWDVIRFFEEIGRLEFQGKDEVILDSKTYTYWDLKKQILTSPDLTQECQDLLKSRKAFELYFNRLGGGSAAGEVSPEEEAPPRDITNDMEPVGADA